MGATRLTGDGLGIAGAATSLFMMGVIPPAMYADNVANGWRHTYRVLALISLCFAPVRRPQRRLYGVAVWRWRRLRCWWLCVCGCVLVLVCVGWGLAQLWQASDLIRVPRVCTPHRLGGCSTATSPRSPAALAHSANRS